MSTTISLSQKDIANLPWANVLQTKMEPLKSFALFKSALLYMDSTVFQHLDLTFN